MIHIVFNTADVDVLKKAIEMDETLTGDVLEVKDDYAVGPLEGIHALAGIEARRSWWREVLAGGDQDGNADREDVNDPRLAEEITGRMREHPDELIWIWAAQNKHDVSGYYWIMSQLKDFQGRVFILYLNNLPFINEKGNIFYPQWLSQIPPREFLKAKKLARPITLSEFEIDPDEWGKHCEEPSGVRILEGGKKLANKAPDHYDADILKYVTGAWQKASKVITQFLNKNRETTGDAYLLWRIKTMVAAGVLDVQGELRGMRDFEIKSSALAGEAATEGYDHK
jgi:hypothetical protein